MTREGTRRWFRRQHWGTQIALVSALAMGVLIGTVVSNGVRAARENPASSAAPLGVPSPVELSSVFSKVAKQVEPAVVNISTVSTIGRRRRGFRDSPEDFFERFFGFGPRRPLRQRSLGSGVLVDARGYILTNYHVVRQADKITVRLHGDSKEYLAEIAGYDQETDLAVIKIAADRKLPVAELGNSDAVEVGDWVLAIGSPFGLEATVTAGIISYKGREVAGAEQFQHFLQTDAAINRGNSGGPLVNMAGQVIGINTMIATDGNRFNAGNVGIGFALPSNIARAVYNKIRTHGRMVRGSIGVSSIHRSQSEREVILRSFGAEYGYIVDEIRPGSPAERAGLQRGDVIIAANGQPVHTSDELVDIVTATPVGQAVALSYIRKKKEHTVAVRVEDRCQVFPEKCDASVAFSDTEGEGARLGLRVEEATPALLQRGGLDLDEDQGLFVREIEPNSFAEDVGLARGDLILEINHHRVRTGHDFREIEGTLHSGSDVVFGLKRRVRGRWIWMYLGRTLP
ncbi:MAG: trypsin-like peptidase domain-containing protein [Terriglobia bacterium]